MEPNLIDYGQCIEEGHDYKISREGVCGTGIHMACSRCGYSWFRAINSESHPKEYEALQTLKSKERS